MCGIYGLTEKNPKIVQNLIDTCSYRGPDGSDIYFNENITLGHNLLSITSKPEDGSQPWISNNGNVLVYNGEIFNYDEILKRFKNNFIPKTSCDTELLNWLLNNYSYREVVSKIIDSMHAFAFYNKKENEPNTI